MAAGMILLVSRRVTRPLVTIQGAMLELAGGNFNVVLPGLDRKDEIGAMANAVEKFKVLAVEKGRQDAEEVLRRQQAEAELQTKAAEERAKVAEEQGRAFRAIGKGLGELSEGDLTFRLDERFPEEYREVKDNFNTAIDRLYETIRRHRGLRAARSPMPRSKSRPAPPTCRSAPRSRPPAWSAPRPRWRKSPPP